MSNKQASYQIHRFRDRVAIWFDSGRTIYLTSKEAAEIASHLQSFADDINTRPFVESKLATVQGTVTGKGE